MGRNIKGQPGTPREGAGRPLTANKTYCIRLDLSEVEFLSTISFSRSRAISELIKRALNDNHRKDNRDKA